MMNPGDHGYSLSWNNYKLFCFHSQKKDSNVITQISKYVPSWTPDPRPGCYTLCIQDIMNNVGIYELQTVVNLYTISPRFVHNAEDIGLHVKGILQLIHKIIKNISGPQVANEIRYKIAFYKPTAVKSIPFSDWVGNWRFTKNTKINLCGSDLGGDCDEYIVRWLFNDDYSIRPKSQFQTTFNTWLDLKTCEPNNSNMEM